MPSEQLLPLLAVVAVALFVLRSFLFGGKRISAADADAKITAGEAVLIDVREPDEWRTGVAKPAALLPLSDLHGARTKWDPFLQRHRGKALIVYCASGMRSATAARRLKKLGFTVFDLGGFGQWAAAGLPTKRP